MYGRVENARAIQVQTQPAPARELARAPEVVERKHLAALGVFQAQQSRPGEMRIVGLDCRLDTAQVERAIGFVVERLRLDAAQHRGATALVLVGMALLADDVLVAALAMRPQRQ